VLAIDQDVLGKEATCAIKHDDLRIYKKNPADGGGGAV
jgi:hypothetical protein